MTSFDVLEQAYRKKISSRAGRKSKQHKKGSWTIKDAWLVVNVQCPDCHRVSTVSCPSINYDYDFTNTNTICQWCDNQAIIKSKYAVDVSNNSP